MIKQSMIIFIPAQKKKWLSMEVALMMRFNQAILQLYQIYENLHKKVQGGLLIQSLIILLVFQTAIL